MTAARPDDRGVVRVVLGLALVALYALRLTVLDEPQARGGHAALLRRAVGCGSAGVSGFTPAGGRPRRACGLYWGT